VLYATGKQRASTHGHKARSGAQKRTTQKQKIGAKKKRLKIAGF
jgi:hypothetical protein